MRRLLRQSRLAFARQGCGLHAGLVALSSVAAPLKAPPPADPSCWECPCGHPCFTSECFVCGQSRRGRELTKRPDFAARAAKGLVDGETRALNVTMAAQCLRSHILRAASSGTAPELVYAAFQAIHPEAAEVIRQAGGPKRVSQDLPHLIRWGGSGALSAPGWQESLQIQRTFRPPRDMTEVFRDAGGSLADMSSFGSFFGPGKRPAAVAIDTEGSHLVPPILIQVCALDRVDTVFLEQPRRGAGLSPALTSLLRDPAVTKVFFDARSDISSLGVPVESALDVQRIVVEGNLLAGTGAAPWNFRNNRPSLTDIAARCIDDGGGGDAPVFRKNRGLQRRFGFMNERPRGRLGADLEWYAASDAWATAAVYAKAVLGRAP